MWIISGLEKKTPIKPHPGAAESKTHSAQCTWRGNRLQRGMKQEKMSGGADYNPAEEQWVAASKCWVAPHCGPGLEHTATNTHTHTYAIKLGNLKLVTQIRIEKRLQRDSEGLCCCKQTLMLQKRNERSRVLTFFTTFEFNVSLLVKNITAGRELTRNKLLGLI